MALKEKVGDLGSYKGVLGNAASPSNSGGGFYQANRGYAPGNTNPMMRQDYDLGVLNSQLLSNIGAGRNVYKASPEMAWGGLIGNILADQYNKRGAKKNEDLFNSMMKGEEVGSRKEGYKPKSMSEGIANGSKNAVDGSGQKMEVQPPDPVQQAGGIVDMADKYGRVEARLQERAKYSNPENPNPGSVENTVRQADAQLAQVPDLFSRDTNALLSGYEARLRADGVRGTELDNAMNYAKTRIEEQKARQIPGIFNQFAQKYSDILKKEGPEAAENLILSNIGRYEFLMPLLGDAKERVARQDEQNYKNAILGYRNQELQDKRDHYAALEAAADMKNQIDAKRYGVRLDGQDKVAPFYTPQRLSPQQIDILQTTIKGLSYDDVIKKMEGNSEQAQLLKAYVNGHGIIGGLGAYNVDQIDQFFDQFDSHVKSQSKGNLHEPQARDAALKWKDMYFGRIEPGAYALADDYIKQRFGQEYNMDNLHTYFGRKDPALYQQKN